VAADSFILGATRGAPPFDAIAQMNRENTVQVVVTRDYSYRSVLACDLLLRVAFCPLVHLPLRVQAEDETDART
jgi:hypothetical protein